MISPSSSFSLSFSFVCQAAEDMKKLLDAHAKTAEERQVLSERLESEAVERRGIEKTKGMLLGKLQAMEAKLIQARIQTTDTYMPGTQE